MHTGKQLRGSLLLLLTAMIWGAGFVAQSAGMEYVGPFTMQACRFTLSGLTLLPVLALRRTGAKSPRRMPPAGARRALCCGGVCGLLLFGGSTLQQFGLLHTTVGKSGFITALYILMVPLLGLFLHQKPGRRIWICVPLALVGLYLLCLSGGDSGVNTGDLLTLACALFFALHILYIDRVGASVDGIRFSCVQLFVTALLSALCMLLWESPSWHAIRSCWLPILYAGVLSGGVAYTLQILGQRDTSPVLASMLLSLESVFAALFGALLLPAQALQRREMLGCGLMFAAILLAQLPQRNRKESPR